MERGGILHSWVILCLGTRQASSQDTKSLTRARFLLFPSTRDGTSISHCSICTTCLKQFFNSIKRWNFCYNCHYHIAILRLNHDQPVFSGGGILQLILYQSFICLEQEFGLGPCVMVRLCEQLASNVLDCSTWPMGDAPFVWAMC